jgi:hypothetical protein
LEMGLKKYYVLIYHTITIVISPASKSAPNNVMICKFFICVFICFVINI